MEFRQRIVAAVYQQEHTIAEVAALFGVSERYVYQLLKLRRETGDLSPLPHDRGAPLKLDEAKLIELAGLVAEFPDAILDELRELLRRRCRINVNINTVWRGLQQIGFTLKKSPSRPGSLPARARRVRQETNDIAGVVAAVFG